MSTLTIVEEHGLGQVEFSRNLLLHGLREAVAQRGL